MPKTFEVAKEYRCRNTLSISTPFVFRVIKRTEKQLTILAKEEYAEPRIVPIKKDIGGNEYCSPFGNYSFAPIMRA